MKYLDQIDCEQGIVNRGNWRRLQKLMLKATRKEPCTIGMIGGSITQGCLSTTPESCYAYLVYDWFCKTFPDTEFHYVNAGIGATTSQFGVARVQEDLLQYRPDLVITEFSVNDENNAHFLETYEGLVRTIYQAEQEPAMVILHNVFYDSGSSAEEQHKKMGIHYEIPCLSIKNAVYVKTTAKIIPVRDITSDNLHPNDVGHALVAAVVIFFLEKVKAELRLEEHWEQNRVDDIEEEAVFPAPLTRNRYEGSFRCNNQNTLPRMKDFTKDEEEQLTITDCFKKGWIGSELGASIQFTVVGTGISVQYRKSVAKPAHIARVVIDGKENEAVTLDANFTEDWGDLLALDTIVEDLPRGEHQVVITIVESQDVKVPFYLAGILVTK